jgi:hypothetical protein
VSTGAPFTPEPPMSMPRMAIPVSVLWFADVTRLFTTAV